MLKKDNKQQGFVSLFTVVFFMLLISVVTIGFLRIMIIEQRQSLDNDLTASALASAESGVEDAKRAIAKYTLEPGGSALKDKLRVALTSNSCNAIFTTPEIATALNISNTGSISGATGLQQFYTCLSVNLNSPDYISSSSAGKSEFIPLRTVSASGFDKVKISWHIAGNSVTDASDGPIANYPTDTLLPAVANGSSPALSWSAKGYPAFIRAQFYGYPNNAFNRDSINDRTKTVMLVPHAMATTNIVAATADPSHNFYDDKSVVNFAGCVGTSVSPSVPAGSYACSATIDLPSSVGNNYFLRLTPLYGATHFKVELSRAGTPVDFSEVQPVVDSTGRANDVFRRVQARVRMTSPGNLPEYGVESADDICRNMQIADGSYYQPNTCP